jgi:flagellar basal-body rod protein FlgG
MSLGDAMQIAVSGLIATDARLQKTASNLARLNELAGKKEYLLITDRSYREFTAPGSSTSDGGTLNPTGYQIGTGVQVVGNYLSFEPGERIQTGRNLDLFIDGDGFFQVNMPDGTIAYTRIGNLQTDNTGRLVIPGVGYTLIPNITFPQDTQEITINNIGQIFARIQGVDTELGQLQMATFLNPSGLRNLGNGLHAETGASGAADIGSPGTGKKGGIIQGAYEGSNIQAVSEIVELVQTEKDHAAITKALKTGEEMWKAVNTIGG